MNCRICGGLISSPAGSEVDGIHDRNPCVGPVFEWARNKGLFVPEGREVAAWADPRWLVTIDAYLEAHPPQREE